MGKGSAGLRSLQRKLHPDLKGRALKPTSLRAIARGAATAVCCCSMCDASNSEEPGAVVPHAGICAGAAGRLAVLPRCAPSEAWRFLPGESPSRVRASHPPVSSVAPLADSVVHGRETVTNVNKRGEAYTENPVGQRGGRTTLKRFQPRKTQESRWRQC